MLMGKNYSAKLTPEQNKTMAEYEHVTGVPPLELRNTRLGKSQLNSFDSGTSSGQKMRWQR